jgi:tagatose-1,6-bisphosphate aldolase
MFLASRPLFVACLFDCRRVQLVTYDDALGDVQGHGYARKKPEHVTRATEEFSKPNYRIDALKVEVPVNLAFVEGARAFGGTAAYTRSDALRLFREAASVAAKPFIYLSAGVSDTVFQETLELAARPEPASPACSAAAQAGRVAFRPLLREDGRPCRRGWRIRESATSWRGTRF